MSAKLTEQEIKDFVAAWYKKLDVHAPMVDLLPMISDTGLEMQFPEATLTTMAEFEGWYQGVIRIFFDEVHNVKEVTTKIDDEKAELHVVVEWQASVWNPPAAKSERIMLDADQDWVVKRSPVTGKPVIVIYKVNGFDYYEGSKRL